MSVSALKICNESNNKKTGLNEKKALNLLLPIMFDGIDETMN